MDALNFYQGIRDQIEQYQRHYQNFFRHLTLKKLVNFIKIETCFFLKTTKVSGRPYILGCGMNNICILRCPLCPTGKGYLGRRKGNMDFVTFKKIIDQIGDCLFLVTITNLGEPFLNPDFFKMVAYAQQKNIGTRISSNLSLPLKKSHFRKLIKSGLEGMVVSLDGVSQQNYSRYRRGGRIEVVFKNLRQLIETKKELRSPFPQIQWQFLVNRFNEGEMEQAQKKAQELGVDDLRFLTLSPGLHQLQPPSAKENQLFMKNWSPRHHALYRHDFRKNFGYPGPCFWLWRGVEYQLDGGLSPCAIWDKKADDFGNLNEQDFAAIWNNSRYQAARSLFRKGPRKKGPQVICDSCRLFKKPR